MLVPAALELGDAPMRETAVVLVLLLLFASSHMLLSSRTIRTRLVARLGDRTFLAAYSVIALVLFVPVVYYYFTHRHAGPLLWSVPVTNAVEFVLVLANVVGFVLLVAGVMTPSPASVTGAPRDEPGGVHRITRHAVFMGLGIWALAHLIPNGFASDVAFFAGIVAFVVVGSWHQDRRKLAGGDPAFERFHAATAFIPFTSREALRGLMELPPVAVIIGVAIALVARYLHPSIGG